MRVEHTDSAAGLLLPNLRLLSSIPQAVPNEVVVPDDLKLVRSSALTTYFAFMLYVPRCFLHHVYMPHCYVQCTVFFSWVTCQSIVISVLIAHADSSLQVYDVLKPNKQFRRGSPDDPRLVVCLATGSNVPSFRVIQHLQQRVLPLPLQFARVAGGQVSFHSMQNSWLVI